MTSTTAVATANPPLAARVRQEASALWQLAWPILIGQLATVGLAVVAVMMAGHASAQDLAGVSLGASIFHITTTTVIGVMMAINPIVAHMVGAGDHAQIPHAVRQALWKALAVGLVAVALMNLAALVFNHLALEPSVRALAQGFVRITSLGLPAYAGYRVLYGYSASLNQTKPMMVIAVTALLLNGLLSALLVYGLFGLPRLGGLGCAWATTAAMWFNLLAMLWWTRRSPTYRSTWPLSHFEPPHWPTLAAQLRLGLPIGVTYFAETSAFGLIALLVARFGTNEVAAHQIALNFASFSFMLPMSIGVALLTRVGQSMGAGDARAARFRAWVGIGVALAFASASALFMALLNQQIAAAYTSDRAVAALAAQLLLLAALFQLTDASQVATSCAIRGYKVTRAPMVIHMLAFWGLSLPLGCVLGLAPGWLPFGPAEPMGAHGFWIALVVALTVAAVGLTALLHRVASNHLIRSNHVRPAIAA